MLDHLKDNNRAWAQGKLAVDPGFFKRLVGQQSPEYLWIGCADSRVPAIKLLRQHYPGLGLKDAKDLVDAQLPT